MFTGVIETLGSVISIAAVDPSDNSIGRRLRIEAPTVAPGLKIGDSIAVNGVCLTVVEVTEAGFLLDVVAETLRRTNLGKILAGDHINLERPLRADGRLDGHVVQGHVDTSGAVAALTPEGVGQKMTVNVDSRFHRYLAEKGSITVDGVSLTVARLTKHGFEVALIPHTLAVTTLGLRRLGDQVNLEFDVLAKYLERLLEARSARTGP